MASLQELLSRTARRLGQIGLSIPLIVVAAFVFQSSVLLVVDPPFFSGTAVSHFAVLRKQYALLSRDTSGIVSEGSFHLFELFIWVASIVGILRVLTGLCSHRTLKLSRQALEKIKRRGGSIIGALSFCLLFAPFVILASLNLQFVSSTIFGSIIARQSPRTFVLLATFVFCGGAFFLAEGLLCLASLMFIRMPSEPTAPNS